MMTRDDVMLKLLAVEPETQYRIVQVTGWPEHETVAVLDRLVKQKKIGYVIGPYGNGVQSAERRRRYFPKVVA